MPPLIHPSICRLGSCHAHRVTYTPRRYSHDPETEFSFLLSQSLVLWPAEARVFAPAFGKGAASARVAVCDMRLISPAFVWPFCRLISPAFVWRIWCGAWCDECVRCGVVRVVRVVLYGAVWSVWCEAVQRGAAWCCVVWRDGSRGAYMTTVSSRRLCCSWWCDDRSRRSGARARRRMRSGNHRQLHAEDLQECPRHLPRSLAWCDRCGVVRGGVASCIVMGCGVALCIVMGCGVASCIVIGCGVASCIVMGCGEASCIVAWLSVV